jgi:hypothetical protein
MTLHTWLLHPIKLEMAPVRSPLQVGRGRPVPRAKAPSARSSAPAAAPTAAGFLKGTQNVSVNLGTAGAVLMK